MVIALAAVCHAAPLHSPKGAEIFAVGVVPVPVRELALWWDYDQSMPVNDLVFEVWHSTDMQNWSLFVEAVQPPVWLTPDKAREFFICRVRNTTTGEVSDWNEK